MRRLCVIIQLKPDSTFGRLRDDVPQIVIALQRHSAKNEMVFRSNDGHHFGWFLLTDKPERVILASVRDSQSFINGDSILIFEVGHGIDGLGFSRQWTWLQRTATDAQSEPF